jgi:hypothetical protein
MKNLELIWTGQPKKRNPRFWLRCKKDQETGQGNLRNVTFAEEILASLVGTPLRSWLKLTRNKLATN